MSASRTVWTGVCKNLANCTKAFHDIQNKSQIPAVKCIEYQDKYVYPCRTSSFRPNERVNYCRHNAEDMFIEGTVAAKGEFPHMVKLGYKNGENKIEWQCGGSLISEKFVLTAAHCTSNIIYQAPHKYHDIALLELDRAGWGNTQNSPDTLQRVLMTKSTPQECSSQYQVNGSLQQGFNETTQICYGLFLYAFGNTCQIACMYTVIGVTSVSNTCDSIGLPGIYTRVSHYLPWIESIVWPN
ncbi:Serine protease HP21 [Operophtera brumata]|uniref:Serine protease HP21 n=1 Tax=Operophtera brumata TaxID=104452 RepID=A0A0L7L881_OPEBR|nr:Serine protease HP21 [Operophtera brumata]